MKKCSAIENLLPLHAEGVLSDAEKRVVEEHLLDCAACQKELAYLQKAGRLVNHLSDVEEPAWFQQKIMARVREEADKQSFTRKWFYPLRIKIPVQIMATIVIAVLAVYIYRSGDEQAKRILPGSPPPTFETQTQQPPAQMPRADEAALPPSVPREKTVSREAFKPDMQAPVQPAAGVIARKLEAPENKSPAAYDADGSRPKALEEKKDAVRETSLAGQKEAGRALPQVADQEKKPGEQAMLTTEKRKDSSALSVPAAPQTMGAAVEAQKSAVIVPEAKILVRAGDPIAAAAEVEKILAGFDSKRMSRRQSDGKTMVSADVPAASWKEMLMKLKSVGPVEEKVSPADASGMIRVTIEISGM